MDNLRDEMWKILQQSLDVHERAHATLINKFFAAYDEAPTKYPAIPKDVYWRIHQLLENQKDDIEKKLNKLSFYIEDSQRRITLNTALSSNKAARDWLESAPVATDKAVCPKCGGGEAMHLICLSSTQVTCNKCKHTFPVQVLVISPPREGKVAP